MFKNWLKQVVVVLMSLIIIVSPFSMLTVHADDYKKNDSDEDNGATYYIIEGENVNSLFDFGISDVGDLYQWIWSFHTFTVIKKCSDGTYKCYFNTPNLQQLVKNQVVEFVPDGYTDSTYDINQTQWLVDVGSGDNGATLQENAITKYGFNIPSYTYMGEYPKETMSLAGIIPSPEQGFWKFLWRSIKALFGASFLKAPDADNFNTLTYLNHTYTDSSEYVVNFFHSYYLPYFVKQIAEDSVDGETYFTDVNDLLTKTVTQDANDAASEYCQQHKKEYDLYSLYERNMNTFGTNYATSTFDPVYYGFTHSSAGVHINDFSGFEDQDFFFGLISTPGFYLFLVNDQLYIDDVTTWLQESEDNRKIFYMANLAWGNTAGYTGYASITLPSSPLGQQMDNVAGKEQQQKLYDSLVALNDGGLTSDMESNKIYPLLYCSWTDPTGNTSEMKFSDALAAYNSACETYNTNLTTYNNYRLSIKGNGNPYYEYSDWYKMNHRNTTDYPTEADWCSANGYPKTIQYSGSWESAHTMDTPNATLPVPVDPKATMTNPYDLEVWIEGYPDCKLLYNTLITGLVSNPTVNLHIRNLAGPNTRDTGSDGTNDFLTGSQVEVLKHYEASQQTMTDYENFITMFNRGTDDASDGEMSVVVYRQCMITNQGEDNECWSEAYGGGRTTITVASLYAYSGLYRITEPYLSGGSKAGQSLSIEDTYKVIKKIQSYAGPYYNQVVANMIKIMCATAKAEGNTAPLNTVQKDDPRVMPYDTRTLLQNDAQNYAVSDPRVDLWYSHMLGNFVGNLNVGGDIMIYFHIQPTIIKLAGKITEVSVFLQQLCDFDVWDSWGLSPANLWESVWITIVMGLLAAYFIIKTVIIIWKNGTQGGVRVIGGFLLLVFELGLMTYVASDPANAWQKFKYAESRVINLGEMATVGSDPDLAYLFGDEADYSVTYYIPYLDTWSKYNTGYGIKADQQQINTSSNLPELVGVNYPKIGSNNVKQYSIMLADSFSYYGDSDSVSHSVLTASGENVNGSTINNNAYRVVDHFMAPRVTISTVDSTKVRLTTATNENYNGEFQGGILDLLTKLLLCCLYCFISVIKFLTFVWFWWMLYLFFFRAIINKVEKKKWADILIETFAPLFAIICMGLLTGIIFILTCELEGLFGLVMVIFLFWFLFAVIRWWRHLRVGAAQIFPSTLEPVYWLTNFKQMQRNRNQQRANTDADFNAQRAGVQFTDEEKQDYEKKTRRLFKEDGTIADEFSNGKGGVDKRFEQVYLDYYEQGLRRQKEYGMQLTALQKAAQDKIKALGSETGNGALNPDEKSFDDRVADLTQKVEYQATHHSSSEDADKIKADTTPENETPKTQLNRPDSSKIKGNNDENKQPKPPAQNNQQAGNGKIKK